VERTCFNIPAARCVRVLYRVGPRKREGAGSTGCRCTRAPRVHEMRKETHTSSPQVQPNTLRHSLRNGLRLIRALPGVPGLLASVACAESCSARLDASVGAPGPRDFARPPRAPLVFSARNASIAPRPAFVTTRTPLLPGRDGGRQSYFSVKRKRNIFSGRP